MPPPAPILWKNVDKPQVSYFICSKTKVSTYLQLNTV